MYSARRCPQAASSLCGVGVRRSFSDGGKSWRTRRMARRKRNVSDLPYAAPPLSCAAFFVKVQKTGIRKAERGGTLRVFTYLS